MHSALLQTHNAVRWVVLVAGVLAITRAAQGLSGGRPYAAARRAGLVFTASLHLQLLLGIGLFLVSPLVETALQDMQATMSDAPTRFFIAEHPTLMVIAAMLATIGGIVAKNAPDDATRHRKALVFIVITLLLLLVGIPWQRPLFPGMGG